MQRRSIVIAGTLIALLLLASSGIAQNSGGGASSNSPGLAEQVEEMQNELDELQDFQVQATGEITVVASRYDQSETLLNNVQKKLEDVNNATVGKFAALETTDSSTLGRLGELAGKVAVLEQMNVAVAPTDDMFVSLTDVEGESTDPGHEGQIDVESWSFGASNSAGFAGGGGGGAGVASLTGFTITKKVDKSSPILFLACASGEHFPELSFASKKKNGTSDYLIVTLTDVLVSSYQTGGSASDAVVLETISFAFREIEIEYLPPGPSAPVVARWNVATSTGGAG